MSKPMTTKSELSTLCPKRLTAKGKTEKKSIISFIGRFGSWNVRMQGARGRFAGARGYLRIAVSAPRITWSHWKLRVSLINWGLDQSATADVFFDVQFPVFNGSMAWQITKSKPRSPQRPVLQRPILGPKMGKNKALQVP
jgi:hypothetical protein